MAPARKESDGQSGELRSPAPELSFWTDILVCNTSDMMLQDNGDKQY